MPLLTRDDKLIERDGKLITVEAEAAGECTCCGQYCGCCYEKINGAIIGVDGTINREANEGNCPQQNCPELDGSYDVPASAEVACAAVQQFINDVCCHPDGPFPLLPCDMVVGWEIICVENFDGTVNLTVYVVFIGSGKTIDLYPVVTADPVFYKTVENVPKEGDTGRVDCTVLNGLLTLWNPGAGMCDMDGAEVTFTLY